MAKAKVQTIEVQCTRDVVNEMCRYDGSEIVSEVLVDNHTDDFVEKNYSANSPEELECEKERFRKYLFTIEGRQVTYARWSSFGVKVTDKS